MISIYDSAGALHPLKGYTNYRIRHKENGEDTLSFYMDTALEQYRLIREEAKIQTEQNEYLVKKIDDNKIDCVLNFDFLKERAYYDYKSETETLLAVLLRHLPAGWTVEGGNVSTIRRTITFDACTDYDVVMQCRKTYSVKFMWFILEKRLVVVDPDQMNPTGEYVTNELNLKSLSFKGETTSFATRLYAYGLDGMTMEEAIVDGSRYGKTYVDNTEYADKVICATWVDERYTVPENLYTDAVNKLADLSWPVRSYSCKVDDLAKQNPRYSFLTFSMWRKITLIDTQRNIRVEHQIVQYDEYPEDSGRNEIVLSCVPKKITDRINEAMESGGGDAVDQLRQELETFINTTYSTDLANLNQKIDGKIETFNQATDPALNWTDADTKAEHVGDLWYDTANQKYYRYDLTENVYTWQELKATPPDSVVTAINGKARIFTSQPAPPYSVGDLWFDSSSSDIMTCTTARASGSYTASDWEKRNKYTDDTVAEEVDAKLVEAVADLTELVYDQDSAVTQALTDRLNMATAMLTTAFGSYFYVDNGNLYMMDDTDPAQAQVVWRWNVNGFGKSSTGIDGPYTTAMTVDDSFLTGVVNATIIRGDLIEANSISAEKIQQTYTDGVLTSAYTAAKGYVDAMFTDLNNYLSNDDGSGQIDILRADITNIQQTIEGLNIDFSESFRGGINYVHNSSGLNGLSDDWETTGTVVTLQSSDTKNYTVSNSCFRISTDSTLKQVIDSVVIGQPYTISAKVKKTGTLLSEVYVIYNGDTTGKLFSSSDAGYGWEEYKFTIDSIQSNTLQIVCTTRSDYLFVSDIMVCEGMTSKAWTPAPDEIYTSGVKIDKRGITVYRNGTSEKTVISNEEFAGYNGDTEIFSLNGDETRIVNAIVRKQLRIEDTMFIPFDSNGEKGLNIALID